MFPWSVDVGKVGVKARKNEDNPLMPIASRMPSDRIGDSPRDRRINLELTIHIWVGHIVWRWHGIAVGWLTWLGYGEW